MRHVVCHRLGPPSVLAVEEAPDPGSYPGRVIVEVEAAGVNFVDALLVAGSYQIKPPLPFTPGNEIAGRVVDVGEGVTGFAVGDRVMASIGLGGYATRVSVGTDALAHVPTGMDAPQAATFVQSYCTSLFALRERGRAEAGQRVLVLGGGGGVGLAAIDVARVLGLEVIAAASTVDKRDAALQAGASEVIDTTGEDLKARTRELTDGAGVDLVIDPIGGPAATEALRTLREGGRYAVIGFASGTIPALPLNQVLLRNREVIGVDWGAWAMSHPVAQAALLADLLEWAGTGRLHPVRPTLYSFDRVAEALQALLDRQVTGKVALLPRPA